jgi:hypothetical protein
MTDTRTAYISLIGLLAILQFAIVIAVTASFAQERDAPLPEGVVAIVNGTTVSEDDYRNFLFHHIGRSKLGDFLDKILIEEEAQRLGVRVTFHKIVDQSEREFEQNLKFFDSPGEYEAHLSKRGLTVEDVKADMCKRLILEETLTLCIIERRKRTGEKIGEASPSLADRQSFLEDLRARGKVKISGR